MQAFIVSGLPFFQWQEALRAWQSQEMLEQGF